MNKGKQQGQNQQLLELVQKLEKELNDVKRFCNSMREAHNHATALLAHVDKFLDEKFPGWDGGFKETTQRVIKDMERFKELMGRLAEHSRGLCDRIDDAELIQIADELWAIAGRNGGHVQEAARIAPIYLQARCPSRARRLLEHLVDDNGEVVEGLNPAVYEMMKRRCDEIEAQLENGETPTEETEPRPGLSIVKADTVSEEGGSDE